MTYRSLIKQGDALTWLARPNTLAAGDAMDGNWVCKAGLFDDAGQAAVAVSTVTAKRDYNGSEYYVVTIARADTAGLAAGWYILAINVRNDTVDPPYSEEEHIDVEVEAQLIAEV